ncbi:hypothetical protein QWJ34_02045 [Saccharibacillus sp. CPCC 101409]|uniref:hypothetical protein n=1 Tax=Saccharibacillus sp. CPCC 101409 TaxID=3058041 RepID=UPI0026735D95|nr:hypothetical protein [Saccharibacillus sp. CPCC 101409]MDO3408543.1 hypothetical protein [Saccharibacillus sp. CPCC 101409]
MPNTATVSYNGNTYNLLVNSSFIYSGTLSQMNAIRDRLNYIFSDTNRDLDFITPSYANGSYVVSCPRVRKNTGQVTYLYSGSSYPEKLYEPSNWENTGGVGQTAILTITDSSTPWVSALLIANRLRNAVIPNFSGADGSNPLKALIVPSNKLASSSIISSNASCEFYGHPCQGTNPGTTSSDCGYGDLTSYQNILNVTVGNGEVLHPGDLTCAMTSSNSWSSLYRNKFIKVINKASNQSIVVRVTDTAPANRGVELTYRAWVSIGKPMGSNTVQIELMGS